MGADRVGHTAKGPAKQLRIAEPLVANEFCLTAFRAYLEVVVGVEHPDLPCPGDPSLVRPYLGHRGNREALLRGRQACQVDLRGRQMDQLVRHLPWLATVQHRDHSGCHGLR